MEQRIPTNNLEKNLLQNLTTIYSLLQEGSPKAIEKIFSLIKTPNQIGVFTIGTDSKNFEIIGNFFALALANSYTNANTVKNLLNNPKFKCDVAFTIKERNQKHTYHPVTYCLGHHRLELVEAFLETPNINWTNITTPIDVTNESISKRLDAPIIFGFIKQDISIFTKVIKKYSDISFFTHYKQLNLIIEIISNYKNDEDLCIQYLESVLANFKEAAKLINMDDAPVNGMGNKVPALLLATELGLTKVIDLLASKSGVKLDISWKYENLATAAVYSEKLNVLQHLHDKKYINPKKVGRALHIACFKQNLAMVDFMIKHNYHQHVPNQAGNDLRNVFNQHFESVIEFGLEIPLQIAVGIGNLAIAKLLIDEGKISIDTIDGRNKRSAIFTAILGEAFTLDWVIQHKADLNLADKNGKTPLLFAIEYQNLNAVKKLVAAGANIEIADDFNITPLMMAVISNNTEIIEFLSVQLNGNLDAKDWHGLTAFDYAAMLDRVDTLKILLGSFSDIEKRKVVAFDLAQLLYKLPQNRYTTEFLLQEFDEFKKAFLTLKSAKELTSDIISTFKKLSVFLSETKKIIDQKIHSSTQISDKTKNNSITFFSSSASKALKINQAETVPQEASTLIQCLAAPLKDLSWFKGALDINDKRNLIKQIRKNINCYLYLSKELILAQAKKQNYLSLERLEILFSEPDLKFHHTLDSNYQIQIQIGDQLFTTELKQEIYIEGKARILVFPIPEEYKDDKSQRGTLYMGIFSKDGLHDQGDINRLLASSKIINIPLPPFVQEESEKQKPTLT